MNTIKIIFLLVCTTACTTLRTSDAFAWMDDVAKKLIKNAPMQTHASLKKKAQKKNLICTTRSPELEQQILQAVQNDNLKALQTLYYKQQLFNAQDTTTNQYAIEIAAQNDNPEAVRYFLETMTIEDMTTLENQLYGNEQRVQNLMHIIFKYPKTITLFFEKSNAKTGIWADFYILLIKISNITANNLAYTLNMLEHNNEITKSSLNRYTNDAINHGSIPHFLTILTYLKKTKSCDCLNYDNAFRGTRNTLNNSILKKFNASHTLKTIELLLEHGATVAMPQPKGDDFDHLMYYWHPDLISTLHAALQHPSQAVLKRIFELTQEKLSEPINITSCLVYALKNNSYNYETISYLFTKGATIDESVENCIEYICLNTSTTKKILQLFFNKGLSFKNISPEKMGKLIQLCFTKLSDKKLALLCENGLPYLSETFYANTLRGSHNNSSLKNSLERFTKVLTQGKNANICFNVCAQNNGLFIHLFSHSENTPKDSVQKQMLNILIAHGLSSTTVPSFIEVTDQELIKLKEDINSSQIITNEILESTTTQPHDTCHATLPEKMRHYMALLFIQKNPENPLSSFKKYCNLFCWKNNEVQKLIPYLYQALPHHLNTAVAYTFQFQDELYRFTKEDAKNDPSQDFVWPCDVAFEYEQ